MKIYVRYGEEIYETRLYKPFMYKDVMYAFCRNTRYKQVRKKGYRYIIVHVLTGQFICTCKTKKIKNNIAMLIKIEKAFKEAIADALTERFGDDVNANINADQWNKLITRLEK